MIFYHDSHNSLYRMPQGAVACGEVLKLRVRGEHLARVWLRLWWNNTESRLPMAPLGTEMFECDTPVPCSTGLLWYYFIAEDEWGGTWYLGNAPDGLGGIGEMTNYEPKSYQVTVYDAEYRTPEWLRNGMMLQIMVDRYHCDGTRDITKLPPASYYHQYWDDDPALNLNDDRYGDSTNNDYFGGNLRGVIKKLDYIQSLGVTVIYFNPIFKARSNHKYNTGDYRLIDPAFGTEADFRELCHAAADRGIRVILDGVFSHTGSDSVYFNRDGNYGPGGAYNDPHSPFASWYRFRRWPDDYECWWGFKTLPNVHEETEAYQNFIINDRDSVTVHWLRAGASGWRLDVADELPMCFIRNMRDRVHQIKPDAAIIGEVWEDPSNKIAYDEQRSYVLGDTLDSTMNYPLRKAIIEFLCYRISASDFVRQIESHRENEPLQFFYSKMNLLGSHDTPRAINILADIGNMAPDRMHRRPMTLKPVDYGRGCRRLLAAWALICALPGMPCLYYGDEAGMTGMADPYCRGTYPWGNEDVELRESFREIMLNRMRSPVLRTGDMCLSSVGGDVVLVERRITGGADVFGYPARNDMRVLAVNRAGDYRHIDYAGCAYDIPGESAMWLTPPEAVPMRALKAIQAINDQMNDAPAAV